jgi:hypothetical protein
MAKPLAIEEMMLWIYAIAAFDATDICGPDCSF